MFVEFKSRHGFEETLHRLSDVILAGGWKIPHTHDLKETMAKNGLSVLPVKVVELCNPRHAYNILSADALRIYANMMPCRIAVYEKEDGSTYVSQMNTNQLSEQIGGVVEQTMSAAFGEAGQFIKDAIK